MDMTLILLVFLGTSFQQVIPGAAKICKIVEEVVRMKENFAFSGQLVRVLTMKTRYQSCDVDQPNCCGNYGCCDNRGWKLFVLIAVGVLAGLLFLAFISVFVYTAVFNRKNQKEAKPIKAIVSSVEPRYSMKTYLTVAGLDPDSIKTQGPPKSALESTEKEVLTDDSDD